jgi:outer membrane protein assembly factor BamB
MFGRLGSVWLIAATILAGGAAKAQMPFPSDLVPSRSALARVGLERHWFTVIPLVEVERVLRVSLAQETIYVQTNYSQLYAIDAESGRHLWSAHLGERSNFARGVAANSYAVFLTNSNFLHCLDKKTGRPIWKYNLGTIPTSSPAADDHRVVVGLTSGKIVGFNLKKKDSKGNETLLPAVLPAWQWATGGPVISRPLLTDQIVAYGGGKGNLYVAMTEEATQLYRFVTNGMVGDGLGAHDTRTLLVPSSDNNLYAVDLLTGERIWTFPSGAPIQQAPMVADHDVLVINVNGELSDLDPENGSPRWTISTQGGQINAVSEKKIYLRSYNRDLFVIDRATGSVLADPGETHVRAGLNLRDYDLWVINRFDDRIYYGTSSGMVVALREPGQVKPRFLRDPKEKPFGYVPPQGLEPFSSRKKAPTLTADPSAPAEDPDAAAPKKEDDGAPKKEDEAAPNEEKKPEGDEPKF